MSEDRLAKDVGINAGSLLIIAFIVWFFSHSDRDTLHEIEQLRDEVAQLRVSVQALRSELRTGAPVAEPAAAASPVQQQPER